MQRENWEFETHTRIPGVAPRLDPRPNSVNERNFDKHTGVVEGLEIARRHHIACRPAAGGQVEYPCLPVVAPMLRGFFIVNRLGFVRELVS